MFSGIPSARFAVSAYPQRDDMQYQSRFETAAAALVNAVMLPLNSLRFRPEKIIPFIEAAAGEVAGLADRAIADYATDLRYRLRREGLNQAMAGRAFALVREVAGRTVGMRHHHAQLTGGWAMLNGKIAEMETGEGKTLTATLPACTAALLGLPVHVITVNDYLAERDARLMEPVYKALGLTVGVVTESVEAGERRDAYARDVTYCTNKQLVFDYLRDRLELGRYSGPLHVRMKSLLHDKKHAGLLLRGLGFAIVDEADSVLVDEAVTPLIISRTLKNTEEQATYEKALRLVEGLSAGVDFTLGRSGGAKGVHLTQAGSGRVQSLAESYGGLWRIRRYREEMIVQALSAKYLFIKDIHYLVAEGKVKIIDEFTGRLMADRSWQRGLHQLVETKEGCELTGQRETIGQISYQRFFRRYLFLSGMSGTVKEIAPELKSVYGLDVARIKPHRPLRRRALPDSVYLTERQKLEAIAARIGELRQQGRPVLVGTRSVQASEKLSELLQRAGLPHRVLNARQNDEEAGIVAEAGQPGRITVATNMAGRGTDIRLGPGVAESGGLHVIATERNASRRIDRQLFGRCGRQGDPGSYEMIVSYEDELTVNHGFWPVRSDAFKALYARLCHRPWLKAMLDRCLLSLAQRRAESHGAAMRLAVLKSEEYISNTLAFSGRLE